MRVLPSPSSSWLSDRDDAGEDAAVAARVGLEGGDVLVALGACLLDLLEELPGEVARNAARIEIRMPVVESLASIVDHEFKFFASLGDVCARAHEREEQAPIPYL